MVMKRFVHILLVFAFGIARGAELGDFDGDKRLSIADVVWRLDGQPLAEGSQEGFAEYPCHGDFGEGGYGSAIEAYYVYIESLRRGVANPLAHYAPLWPYQAQAPRPPDARVSFRLEASTAPGGSDDRVKIS